MPSNKKKSSVDKRKKQQARRLKQSAAQDFRSNASEFRELLLRGRKEYAKGRAYDAVELQARALAIGSEKLPRFDDDSLVKAHALLELALARSAIQTDFATDRTEWAEAHKGVLEASAEALQIFEKRVAKGTLAKFRKEECWIDASLGEYASPVPHTERLGPVDYLQCVKFLEEPTPDTVRSFKLAISFVNMFEGSGRVIHLEGGGALQGELPDGELAKLNAYLREHEAVAAGRKSKMDAIESLFESEDHKEVRHTGSLTGKMKNTHKKLAKDADKVGYKRCANPGCAKIESQPRQFSTCSRCSWAAYCCRDCQVGDWKRHKKECSSGKAAQKAQEQEAQNKSKSCLMVGQSQQVLLIVTYLHHFAVTSDELKKTETVDAMRALVMVEPKVGGLELGSIQLGVQETALVWNAIWSMERKRRNKMFRKFVEKTADFRFPKGGPDFGVVEEWGRHGISGEFAVVKHTEGGTILLHAGTDADDGDDVRGYLAVGITQSIESLLASVPDPLPVYVNTALFPFKKVMLCQGTINIALGAVSDRLRAAARAFVDGDRGGVKLIESLP